jgi:hypothetical protein
VKKEGWESLLAAHIAEASGMEFAWGKHDCALWCARWVYKATGRDYFSDWQGKYSTEEELDSLLRREGFSKPSEIVDMYANERSLAFAKRGDLVLHPCGSIGICAGKESVFITAKGIITERTMRCAKAWEIE